MKKIITVGREFGSGGRELGRRLAEELGYEYYDKEILAAIAEETSLSVEYVRNVVEGKPHRLYPITVGQSFYFGENPYYMPHETSIFAAQKKIICDLAEKSPCVIVGRCADYILRDREDVYRIFVYADTESKVARCLSRQDPNVPMDEKKLVRHIRKVDKNRARYYRDYTGRTWGDRENYDLLVNTSAHDIKELVPHIAALL